MFRTSTTVAYVLPLTLLVTLTASQGKPDFSGVWKPVDASSDASTSPAATPPTPSGPPPPPSPPRALSTTIVQSASELRVHRRLESGGRETVQTFVYKLDGSESVNQMGPIVFKTTARWEGAVLVLVSDLSVGGKPFGESRETYRLADGNLMVEMTRQTPAGTRTFTGVNKKER